MIPSFEEMFSMVMNITKTIRAIDDLKSKDVLGLDIVEGKEAFMLAVALGLNTPADLPNKNDLPTVTTITGTITAIA